MKRALLVVGLLLLLRPSVAHAAATYDVGELNSSFRNGQCPSPTGNNFATIAVGDTVKWTNCDDYNHDIDWDSPGLSDPPLMHAGEFVAQTFTKAGFFDYHCAIHPGMKGRVIVQPSAAPATTRVTAGPATTTTALSYNTAPTTTPTTADISGVFATPTSSAPEETTTTTEADTTPIENKDKGANAGIVALTLVGIGAVVGGGIYVVRRMRSTS